MTLVRLIRGCLCEPETNIYAVDWQGITFTNEPVEKCDYVVVSNTVPYKITVNCPKENVWLIMHEPPAKKEHYWFRKAYRHFYRVYTSDTSLQSKNIVHTHAVMSWLINKDYQFLSTCSVPDKPKKLSWVTSNLNWLPGHQKRMNFLNQLQQSVQFDLWGRGFNPVADKWDGLAPYRYSLAVENYNGPYYWTEKIADCFLSYTMPIYYGCTNINSFFPLESYISIDINQPEEAIAIIKDVIESDHWIRNRDAIIYARELILNKYQIYPFISQAIQEHEAKKIPGQSQWIELPETKQPFSQYCLEQSIALGKRTIPAPIRALLWDKIGSSAYQKIVKSI